MGRSFQQVNEQSESKSVNIPTNYMRTIYSARFDARHSIESLVTTEEVANEYSMYVRMPLLVIPYRDSQAVYAWTDAETMKQLDSEYGAHVYEQLLLGVTVFSSDAKRL